MRKDVGSVDNNAIVPHFDDEKDESLKIQLQRIEDVKGCLVLYLTGYVDTYNSNYFQKRVAKAIEAGFIKLIIDLHGYNEVSSCGIGSFTAFLKAVKPRGGDLVILDIHPKVLECWELLEFSKFFNIKNTLDEAVGFFIAITEDSGQTAFPRILKCPICGTKLRAAKSGRFRCSECKTILAVEASGQVYLG
jgi:anti-anti-sigma factor